MAHPTASVAVLGAGSWGTALAALIARHGFATTLWGRDAAVVEAIDRRHENPRYLPGIPLPESLRATTVYLPLNRVADQIHVAQAALAAQPADTTAAVQAVDRALGSIFEVVHGVNVVRTAR